MRGGGGGKHNIHIPPPPSLYLFLTIAHPLGTNVSFSPQPTTAIKIKDGGPIVAKKILSTHSDWTDLNPNPEDSEGKGVALKGKWIFFQ